MNFFQQLIELASDADVTLRIKAKDGTFAIHVLPEGCDKIQACLVNGTAADLDEDFVNKIRKPAPAGTGITVTPLPEEQDEKPAAKPAPKASAPVVKKDEKKKTTGKAGSSKAKCTEKKGEQQEETKDDGASDQEGNGATEETKEAPGNVVQLQEEAKAQPEEKKFGKDVKVRVVAEDSQFHNMEGILPFGYPVTGGPNAGLYIVEFPAPTGPQHVHPLQLVLADEELPVEVKEPTHDEIKKLLESAATPEEAGRIAAQHKEIMAGSEWLQRIHATRLQELSAKPEPEVAEAPRELSMF